MAETIEQTPTIPSSEELNKAVKDVAAGAALADKGIPLEVKLTTGQVYHGSTPQELLDQLVKAQENSSMALKQTKDELAQIRAEQVQRVQEAQHVQADNEYSDGEYYKLFAENPRKAQEYLDRFDPEKQEYKQTIEGMRRQSEIDRFKANVGFAPTQEEAVLFGQEFAAAKMEPTANNLELMFYRLVNQGKIRAPQISGVSGQQAPPPNLGGGSTGMGGGGFDMAAFRQLPADQQKQVIEKLRAQGYK